MAEESLEHCWTTYKFNQYLNMLVNEIIDDKTGESPEYRNLIKCNKQKNIWVRYFANRLVCLPQVLGDRVNGTKRNLPGT